MIINITNFVESVLEQCVSLFPKDWKQFPEDRLAMAAVALVIAIFLGLLIRIRQQRRKGFPAYDWHEIPSGILHHLASKKTLHELDNNVDVAIVGSGMGALTTASILAKCGYRVVVLEQHTTIGGSTHTYSPTKDFDFDVGIHYIGGQLDRWWSFRMVYSFLTDGALEWHRIDRTYDVAFNTTTGDRLEFTGNRDHNRYMLQKKFPQLDPSKLEVYYKRCAKARRVAYISFVLKALPPFFTRLAWNWFGFGSLYKEQCATSTLQVMRDECGLPEDVIGAITYSYGDYGTPPEKSAFLAQAFMDNH